MEFFNSAVDVLQTLVVALGAGLVSGVVSTSWRDTEMITLEQMLMCSKVTQRLVSGRCGMY